MQKQTVPIELGGKTRQLRLDYNGFCALESALPGANAFDPAFWADLTPNKLRVLLWAALRHEDKTLDVNAVGDLIELDRFQEIVDAVAKSYELAMPPAPKKKTADGAPPVEQR
jgi:hypothetical protein